MAKFVYRMQNILDIKLKLEDQAKIAYGIANRRLAEEQEKLQTILIRRTGFERHAKELMNGPLDMGKIKEFRRAIDVLKSMQRTQMMNVQRTLYRNIRNVTMKCQTSSLLMAMTAFMHCIRLALLPMPPLI